LSVSGERAPASSPPECEKFAALFGPKPCRDFGQGSEDHCAVIISELDQPGLRNQATKLD
jgi:hypothetical protein